MEAVKLAYPFLKPSEDWFGLIFQIPERFSNLFGFINIHVAKRERFNGFVQVFSEYPLERDIGISESGNTLGDQWWKELKVAPCVVKIDVMRLFKLCDSEFIFRRPSRRPFESLDIYSGITTGNRNHRLRLQKYGQPFSFKHLIVQPCIEVNLCYRPAIGHRAADQRNACRHEGLPVLQLEAFGIAPDRKDDCAGAHKRRSRRNPRPLWSFHSSNIAADPLGVERAA